MFQIRQVVVSVHIGTFLHLYSHDFPLGNVQTLKAFKSPRLHTSLLIAGSSCTVLVTDGFMKIGGLESLSLWPIMEMQDFHDKSCHSFFVAVVPVLLHSVTT